MKLILREYLSSLREREELDAILPDLLSELGYTVYSRPGRGTVQHGVDVAAVSPPGTGEQKVYLFSVKKGDLTRSDWNSGPQALRQSLDSILDAYIRSRIPEEYSGLKIVICLCFGGDMQEQVRPDVDGYKARNTTDLVSFEEWNGDRIAGFLLQGLLKEEVLPRPLRSNFRKAVALLDEPDVAYSHFARLVRQVLAIAQSDEKACVRAGRQIYVAVWVLYVWGRDLENLEAPYKASELGLLTLWDILKPSIGVENAQNADLTRLLNQLIQVHLTISSEFIGAKIAPYVGTRDALSTAVQSRSAVDVNLKLFDLLGRIAMSGYWTHWLNRRVASEVTSEQQAALDVWLGLALTMIENNPSLRLPISDEQTTDIGLFLLFWLVSGTKEHVRVFEWLGSMAQRLNFTIRTRGCYPASSHDYRDLIRHPKDKSDIYFEEQTVGSTLIPTLTAWLAAMGATSVLEGLSALVAEKLAHSTMQLWSPDEDSDHAIYSNTSNHGRALCNLPITPSGKELIEFAAEDCEVNKSWSELTALRTGFDPIVLLACRHWRLPIPPGFYIHSLKASVDRVGDGAT